MCYSSACVAAIPFSVSKIFTTKLVDHAKSRRKKVRATLLHSSLSPHPNTCIVFNVIGKPPGYDRVRSAEIGNKDFELDVLEEAYTTEHWLVRIYKVYILHSNVSVSAPRISITNRKLVLQIENYLQKNGDAGIMKGRLIHTGSQSEVSCHVLFMSSSFVCFTTAFFPSPTPPPLSSLFNHYASFLCIFCATELSIAFFIVIFTAHYGLGLRW